jgi:hypothetical protein
LTESVIIPDKTTLGLFSRVAAASAFGASAGGAASAGAGSAGFAVSASAAGAAAGVAEASGAAGVVSVGLAVSVAVGSAAAAVVAGFSSVFFLPEALSLNLWKRPLAVAFSLAAASGAVVGSALADGSTVGIVTFQPECAKSL